ncbi:uncharacterized protein DUF1707 [Kribbella amoyensis]|uniref:Uncharacterized protein DUF1707 n=1 Tax=Kribbella amoyensis TaxID=996641 RepID=A0A561BJT2_9ACTN|nr:DUF1707 domain-containing protein [Kribbella amoyensis]TWD79123.1 uncharacterized protein DUF1707 [Kribbella amoyensis]
MSQYFPTQPNFPWSTPSRTRPGTVRIGDAERDQAVAVLSDHFVAGRLTQEEFEDRSDQATRARYSADLVPLFEDLPDQRAVQPGVPSWSPALRGGQQRFRPGPPFFFLAPLLMIGLLVATIAVAGPWILWFLFWIALFAGPLNHHHRRRRHHPYRR